jgi:ferredoxin
MGYDLTEKAVPQIKEETCAGCGLCVQICGDQVLLVADGKAKAGGGVLMGCIACGQCAAICPTGSISVTGRGMTPADTVELPPAAHRSTADQLEIMLLARRSIRRFLDKPVERATIDRILDMTAMAPMGIPPSDVGVVVFHGHDRVQAFAEDACQAFDRIARFFNPVMLTLMRPILGGDGYRVMRGFVKPLLQMLAEKRDKGEDWFTYHAPAAFLFHYGPMSGPPDCHIATAYAMLAAESLGLGSCLLGTTEALNHAKSLKAKYGVPAANKFGLGLVVGYTDAKFRRGITRHLASVRFA